MKKTKFVLAVILLLLISLSAFIGCSNSDGAGETQEPDTNDLIFMVDGEAYETVKSVTNERQTVPAAPEKEGFIFDGWYFDNGTWKKPFMENSLMTFDITGDICVYAKFTAIEYKIKYELNGGDHSNPTRYTAENEVVLMPATKNAYAFEGWYTDANFTNKVTSIPVGTVGDITLYAKYDVAVYTITYENTKGAVNENLTSYTAFDERVELKDLSCEGFVFEGWYNGDTLVTYIPDNVSGNVTLTARWSPEWNEISTVEELKNISLDRKYRLVGDIDCGGMEWTPIGDKSNPFLGAFDGNGYTVSNFKMTENGQYLGLFAYNKGTIMNLKVTDVEINVTHRQANYKIFAGGIAAKNNGTIENCYTDGSIYFDVVANSSSLICGGIAGENNKTIKNCTSNVNIDASSRGSYSYVYAGGIMGDGNIERDMAVINCHASGNLTVDSGSDSCVGGLIGRIPYGNVSGSSATGNINIRTRTSTMYVGGLVGDLDRSCTVSNCFATGDIVAQADSAANIGGLVGANGWESTELYSCIEYCYATGNISVRIQVGQYDDINVGGLIGNNCHALVRNSFSTGEISRSGDSGRIHIGKMIGLNIGWANNCHAVEGTLIGTSREYYSNGTVMNSGEDSGCTVETLDVLQSLDFCTNGLGWSTNVWSFEDGQYPALKDGGYNE